MQNAQQAGSPIQIPYSYMLCIELHLHSLYNAPYVRDLSLHTLYLEPFRRTPQFNEYDLPQT